MHTLPGVDDDALFEPILAALRSCVRVEPEDGVTLLHATPVAPWLRRRST